MVFDDFEVPENRIFSRINKISVNKMQNFEQLLGRDNPILRSITDRGFENPSEIQELSIPNILEGKDVIAGASTGSGKTLAFAAGLIKNTKKGHGIQGFVITPTRELAEQITRELLDFSKYKNLNILSVYGGVSIYNQVKMLNSAEIVVATPGRILDHLEKNTIDLSKVNTLVLDEADRMFDMGFRQDVESIIRHCPKKRQTLLFSATITQDVVRLADKHMKDSIKISAKAHVDPKKLKQIYYDVEDDLKYSLLKHLIENEKSKLIMIFCNTRKNVDFVSNNLKFMGLNALPLHGGFTQDKRNRFIEMFHKKQANILVATDVAARGLDIKGVSHIYNYDIPLTKDDYTHRIGRTARAGEEGKVINILTGRHYENFQDIIQSKEFNISTEKTPYLERVRIRWMPEKRHERTRRRNDMSRERSNSNWNKDRKKDGDRSRGNYGNRDSRGPRSNYGGDRKSNWGDNKNKERGNWNNNRDSRGPRSNSNWSGNRDSRGRDSGRPRSNYNRDDNRGSRNITSRDRNFGDKKKFNRNNFKGNKKSNFSRKDRK